MARLSSCCKKTKRKNIVRQGWTPLYIYIFENIHFVYKSIFVPKKYNVFKLQEPPNDITVRLEKQVHN